MKIAFLCRGDPETRTPWSGISKSVVDAFRQDGHTVKVGDVEPSGPTRWLNGLATFSPRWKRWRVNYKVGTIPFEQRSRSAARYLNRCSGEVNAILQIGATFDCPKRPESPLRFLYCDSNIAMAMKGSSTQQSPAVYLSKRQLQAVMEREAGVYRKVAGVFTFSEGLRRSFIEDFRMNADRVTTVYAGANVETSDIPPMDACQAARVKSPPTILFVGVQFERKGGDVLLEAFRTVRQVVPNAHLVVIGSDPGCGDLPGVETLGFLNKDRPEDRSRLVEAFRSASVFCLPTRYEAFGIVFVEAMMFYLPCVGTRTSAVPEIIEEGQTGYTVPVDDTEALAERLIYLLTHREVAQRMGEAGRARAEDRFTWLAVARKMASVMESSSP